ncbi:FecR family protein [Pedobacter frigoris]|uniref:FecR family protein n=1 Tax=Pedobacter frigoris TaxID=2571272 RepID=UPI00292CE37A|nr:FecR domain-containing protein [Pedobacter frigoris]
MQQVNIKELADKFSAGNCTEEELAILENWYLQWKPEDYEMDSDRLDALMKSVWEEMPVHTKDKTIKLWPRVAAVAAAVAMVVFGVWFFNYRGEILRDALDDKSVVQNDVAPGKNGATITLGNGKVIELSDAKSGVVIGEDKLAYNDGTEIDNSSLSRSDILLRRAREGLGSPRGGESSAGAKDMTASTTKGQTYIFTLPDGTKVWLNAASTLTIPSDFSGTESRKVELTGEAYFEVAKNKKRPFIVESNGHEVTVLGTHFNISAYADEGSIKTTLLEGSVSVRHAEFISASRNRKSALQGRDPDLRQDDDSFKLGEAVILKPNQQSVVSGSNRISVTNVDAGAFVDWKNGEFIFEGETLESIMRKVARWYDIEVTYAANAPKEFALSGVVSRTRNISAVLERMESTGKVNFKIEGKKVTVMGVRK